MKSIREYHEATKHSWEKLYQDRHFLDWANQPSPFRTYLDCPQIDLGSSFEKMDAPLSRIWYRNHVKPRNGSITLNTLSTLLYYSMAISAWKSYPDVESWSLRVNPSSGDLHPTETHLYVYKLKDLPDGAYHYFVKEHQLEQRAAGELVPTLWRILGGTSLTPPIIIGLNTIFWREAWKYQSRALRYCYLDLGHAMAAMRVAAHGLGLFVLFIGKFCDNNIRKYLRFDEIDERPLLFLALDTKQPVTEMAQKEVQKRSINAVTRTNRLSSIEVDYPLISKGHSLTSETIMSSLSKRSDENPQKSLFKRGGLYNPLFEKRKNDGFSNEASVSISRKNNGQFIEINEATPTVEYPLKWTIRHRRSAIDFDGKTILPLSVFDLLIQLLCSTYEADYRIPESQPLIIPYLYVHRVEGLEGGVYYFDIGNKRLCLLSSGDMQYVAKELSLNQDIAGDSSFAISFISNFDYALQTYGNRGYRYIHYEAGFMGQALYLGATATGFDATGIGAFIDDEVHTFLKTPSEQQVVYHFTVGKRVDDPRISALPAYNHVHDIEEDVK
ncbi:MAG: SagB/ThcOx family dehydrogenase [Candidatus Brocadia sp.]|nr:SagB/ThcOx family dehydrogenase [Candidatus Brocadia sp.]